MKQKLHFIIIGLGLIFLAGCEKGTNANSNGKVELYLIDSFSRIGNSCQIDDNSIIIKNSPLIEYDDFLSYDSSEYTFEITKTVKEKIKNLQHSVNGLPFAIEANDNLIYSGYFWPSFSSASCNWIVIDPLFISGDKRMPVRLGYPGSFQGQEIQDNRNDERIIEIFKHDNKLK